MKSHLHFFFVAWQYSWSHKPNAITIATNSDNLQHCVFEIRPTGRCNRQAFNRWLAHSSAGCRSWSSHSWVRQGVKNLQCSHLKGAQMRSSSTGVWVERFNWWLVPSFGGTRRLGWSSRRWARRRAEAAGGRGRAGRAGTSWTCREARAARP